VREAGVISSGELAGSALGGLLVLLYGRVFSVRATLAASVALTGIANLGTAVAHEFNTIALCRIAASLGAGSAPVRGAHLPTSLSLTPRGAVLLVSLFATYPTSTALWTYLERIAVAARLPGDVVSIGLSIGMISGAAGSLGATLLLIRARNTDAFVMGGVAALAVSTGLLIKASEPTTPVQHESGTRSSKVGFFVCSSRELNSAFSA